MDNTEGLHGILHGLETTLNIYIKRRDEASQIRRVLASYNGSYAKTKDEGINQDQLSLVDATWKTRENGSLTDGLYLLYLKSVQANIAAHAQYTQTRSKEAVNSTPNDRKPNEARSYENDRGYERIKKENLRQYSHLACQCRKLDRLKVVQEYLDCLRPDPAAEADVTDAEVILDYLSYAPELPSEVLAPGRHAEDSISTDLERLVEKLERTILRARLLLKKEQALLAHFQGTSHMTSTSFDDDTLLEALGKTRNELIAWIEAELSNSCEVAQFSNEEQGHQKGTAGYLKNYEARLQDIQALYARYLDVRHRLIVSAAAAYHTLTSVATGGFSLTTDELRGESSPFIWRLHFHLLELLITSWEQKSTNQQKYYFTTSFAKYIKEFGRSLDLQAEESQLLRVYRMSADKSQPRGLQRIPPRNRGIQERPDSLAQARCWAYASEYAGIELKGMMTERLEEGEQALADARNALSKIHKLLGLQVSGSESEAKIEVNPWANLDAKLPKIND